MCSLRGLIYLHEITTDGYTGSPLSRTCTVLTFTARYYTVGSGLCGGLHHLLCTVLPRFYLCTFTWDLAQAGCHLHCTPRPALHGCTAHCTAPAHHCGFSFSTCTVAHWVLCSSTVLPGLSFDPWEVGPLHTPLVWMIWVWNSAQVWISATS